MVVSDSLQMVREIILSLVVLGFLEAVMYVVSLLTLAALSPQTKQTIIKL
jgi:hypothetical protein